MFRRKKDDVPADGDGVEADQSSVTPDAEAAELAEAEAVPEVVIRERPAGPWDVDDEDAPEGPPEGFGIVDFGCVRVTVPSGVEVRVDVDPATSEPSMIGVVDGDNALQVMAFAAPRSAGIWDDIRQEIARGISSGGGTVDVLDGDFGPELKGKVPLDGRLTPARFLGVDGPRWFLRGVLTGPAATDDAASKVLRQVFRDIVVSRDSVARPPQEQLPIVLPDGEPAATEGDEEESLNPFERGPEITEIR